MWWNVAGMNGMHGWYNLDKLEIFEIAGIAKRLLAVDQLDPSIHKQIIKNHTWTY